MWENSSIYSKFFSLAISIYNLKIEIRHYQIKKKIWLWPTLSLSQCTSITLASKFSENILI